MQRNSALQNVFDFFLYGLRCVESIHKYVKFTGQDGSYNYSALFPQQRASYGYRSGVKKTGIRSAIQRILCCLAGWKPAIFTPDRCNHAFSPPQSLTPLPPYRLLHQLSVQHLFSLDFCLCLHYPRFRIHFHGCFNRGHSIYMNGCLHSGLCHQHGCSLYRCYRLDRHCSLNRLPILHRSSCLGSHRPNFYFETGTGHRRTSTTARIASTKVAPSKSTTGSTTAAASMDQFSSTTTVSDPPFLRRAPLPSIPPSLSLFNR